MIIFHIPVSIPIWYTQNARSPLRQSGVGLQVTLPHSDTHLQLVQSTGTDAGAVRAVCIEFHNKYKWNRLKRITWNRR